MLTVLTLLKLNASPDGEHQGERPFWREFGARYLDAWLANVRRYVPEPKRIRVMTDAPEMVALAGAEPVALDADVNARGFFAKLNAFRPDVSSGKTLYCDLDNVICQDLSALCALEPDPMFMLDDRRVPRLPNGSVLLFDADRCRGIWKQYAKHPRQIERDYRPTAGDYSKAYDQAFIAEWLDASGYEVPLLQDWLPLGYCLNAVSELPHEENWRDAHLIFGSGGAKEGKPHTAPHQVFRENWAST